jgi:hypothetical protein
MWILSFVPDSWLHFAVLFILTTGLGMYAVSFFTRFIPPLIPYSGVARILGTILVVIGIYFYGSYSTEMSWREKVAEVEAKVAAAEVKSKDANVVIQKVYVDKIKVITDTKIVIQKEIVEKEKIIDAQCVVAPDALNILNEAAKNPGASK